MLKSNFCRSAIEILDEHQALVKQFAHILEFVFEFDECKMAKSELQNDFSYFKRITQRMGTLINEGNLTEGLRELDETQHKAREELLDSFREIDKLLPSTARANLSMYLAFSNPMLQSMSKDTIEYFEKNKNECFAKEILSLMAKVTKLMILNTLCLSF